MNAPAELKQRGEVIPFADPATDPSALDLTAEGRTYSIILPDQATDYIQKKIATERRPYELEMLLDMQRRVAAGDLTLDVGANVGNHTLFLAAVAGCRVVAFEPNRHLCGALLSSVELNGLNGQVHVRALAVGKRAGIARFAQAMPENLGGQRIEVGQGGIQVCALDSLRFEQTVKLIKIDVEGMELDVLTGAAELLRSDRPVLYVECGTEAEFRGVSAWLDNASYSYWDTFNATPTHLFLPNEQLTVEQRIARLQYKVARDDYRTTQQLEVVRKKLDDANLKYRSATEQIATLKQRVAQEEAAQKIGNETAQRLKQQIDEAEKSLAELKTLRDERQQMSVRLAQREAELGVQQAQLDKLEQAGALLRQELSAAVLARQAHELNAARLGEDLARAEEDSKSAWDARNELERALEAARGHAHAQVEAAQARILVLEEQSTDLNAQRQALEEEAASLRTRLGRAEAAAREAGERLAQGEQLALREREDEREHLKRLDWRVAELQARLDATAARETELLGQQCCHLEELVELRTKLATTLQAGESAQARLVEERERHERERASSEVHLQALRERLDAEQRALASANLDLGRRQAEGEALQARLQEAQARIRESAEELSQLKDVVEREIRARHVVEATAASAQAEVASAREALRDFREQLRDVDDQRLPFAALQEQYNLRALVDEIRTSAEADLRSARERIEGIEAVRRQLSDSLADSERACDARAEEVKRLAERIGRLEADQTTAVEQLRAMQNRVALKSGELQALTARHENLKRSHDSATALLAEARRHGEQQALLVEGLRAELAELRGQLEEAQACGEAQQARAQALNEALSQARTSLSASRADASRLASEVETLSALDRARQLEFDHAKVDALRTKVALAEANTRLEQSRQFVIAAQAQTAKVRSTLSFQLGHALIFGFKSWQGFKSLPARLLEIRREAHHRRAEGASPAVAVPLLRVQDAVARPSRPLPLPQTVVSAFAPPGPVGITAETLKSMKVAAIMDEFTHGSFRDECNLLQLTPDHWRSEFETFLPELLFIESAWRGKDALWGSKVGHMSQEVLGIVQWCREHEVPTVFWNKEDPVHFETFLSTAKLFDHVFTTDIDCIHRYKAALGHERVYLLPFACQPRVHNPIEIYERKDSFCFAGAYYAKYPDRTRDLGTFVASLPDFKPVEIYDRNFGKTDTNYMFPPEYRPFIVGNLPFDQIDKAYKGYRYAINLNSIKQSQSMFARRVFELLGSNTVTVSNYSRGVRLMFGDLVQTSDSGIELLRRLRELCGDEAGAAKLRLAALRKVMSEHTYQDRLAYVASRVKGEGAGPLLPCVVVLGYAKSVDQVRAISRAYSAQSYGSKSLVLVVPAGHETIELPAGTRIISAVEAQQMLVSSLAQSMNDWLAVMVPDDHYGVNYLLDLVLATRYAEASVIGKASRYIWSPAKGLQLADGGKQYRRVEAIPVRASIARLENVRGNLREWVGGLYTAQYTDPQALSIDQFNYCRNGAGEGFDEKQRLAVDDKEGVNPGLSLKVMLERAEAIVPARREQVDEPRVSAAELALLLGKAPQGSKVRMHVDGSGLTIESTLEDGKHEYWYATSDHTPQSLGSTNGTIKFHLEHTPGLNLQLVLMFLDAQRQRIASVVKHGNRNQEVEVPAGAEFVRLGLRIYAAGSARVDSLILAHRSLQPTELLGHGEHLLLTNHYPSEQDLYRNGFVHRRVVAYARHGVRVDVFRLRADEPVSYHEFEDVDCITGSQQALDMLLSSGRYRTVLVHFLDEAMWDALKRHVDRVKVVVWVHGAEIQPYHRRAFMYKTEVDRRAAEKQSSRRVSFWRQLLVDRPDNLELVFVSRHFAQEAFDDLDIPQEKRRHVVIHNPIDTSIFIYQPKDAEQRRRILSVRPYTSSVYANDLAVDAILTLSKRPGFDKLQFLLAGDGPLFEQTVAPLRGMPNVELRRGFMTQREIASLHRSFGVFLCPTRMDTQGVSRDEAMASGLVPVTSRVAAVPEFVDDRCGFLAPAEDSGKLADAIMALQDDPARFIAMSSAAAEAVKATRAADAMVSAELALLK